MLPKSRILNHMTAFDCATETEPCFGMVDEAPKARKRFGCF